MFIIILFIKVKKHGNLAKFRFVLNFTTNAKKSLNRKIYDPFFRSKLLSKVKCKKEIDYTKRARVYCADLNAFGDGFVLNGAFCGVTTSRAFSRAAAFSTFLKGCSYFPSFFIFPLLFTNQNSKGVCSWERLTVSSLHF